MYACTGNKKDSLNILMFDHCQKIKTNYYGIRDTNAINFQNKLGFAAVHECETVECMQILLECPHINVNLREHRVK